MTRPRIRVDVSRCCRATTPASVSRASTFLHTYARSVTETAVNAAGHGLLDRGGEVLPEMEPVGDLHTHRYRS
jgi:hypothetical protein